MSLKNTPNNNNKTLKKKKSRFFETYISKILKSVSGRGITSNAKQQLNSAMCFITRELANSVIQLTLFAKKKTLSVKEVENAVKIMFTGELSKNALIEGEKSIEKIDIEMSKGTSKQNKAGIIVAPSVAEKFLRNFGASSVMVSKNAPVFLAAIIDYTIGEILTSASEFAMTNKRVRITIRDLEMSIQKDSELSNVYTSFNISIIGGGVVPYIHESLTLKKPVKKKKVEKSENEDKKSRKFRSGTVAIREIKKYQKMSNCLMLPKVPFERYVRSLIADITNDFIETPTPMKISNCLLYTSPSPRD